jgi:uridine phosphorylase
LIFRNPQTKETLTSLNIRIGTSGSLQADIPVDSFVMSKFGLGLDKFRSYLIDEVSNLEMEDAFVKHTNWDVQRKTM